MITDDLNDVILFEAIVTHGGINAASRATGLAKSRLSRRLRELEMRLGARLVERTTSNFCVTPLGIAFHAHCQKMLEEMRAAEAMAQSFTGEPRGLLRVATPPGPCAQAIAGLLPRFLSDYPNVQVQLVVGLRRVDLIREKIDVAVRVRSSLDTDAEMIVKRLDTLHDVLVASPDAIERFGEPRRLVDLDDWPIIGNGAVETGASGAWNLVDQSGATHEVRYNAVAASDDPNVSVLLALTGLGAALVPVGIAGDELASGRLRRILPQWQTTPSVLHLVFPSRRGMLPGVRILIDRMSRALLDRFRTGRLSEGLNEARTMPRAIRLAA